MNVKEEQVLTSDQDTWCGKTSQELSVPTKAQTSERSCKKQSKSSSRKPPLFLSLKKAGQQQDASQEMIWEENGALRGEYSMHSFGECPSVDVGSHLSQILEASPHPKYSLSAKACNGILTRAERRGKPLPPLLKATLQYQSITEVAFMVTKQKL